MKNDMTETLKYIQCGDITPPNRAIVLQVLWILPPSTYQDCLMAFKPPNDIIPLPYAGCVLLFLLLLFS